MKKNKPKSNIELYLYSKYIFINPMEIKFVTDKLKQQWAWDVFWGFEKK